MRLFLAVKIPDEIKGSIAHFLEPFLGIRAKVKWVEPQNLHLTLKFLGETPESRLPDLKEAARMVAIDPFELTLSGSGAFPNLKAPRVFWIGVKEPEKRLTQLAEQIDYNLSQFGWEREKRRFSPHLTLGRVKDRSGLAEVCRAFEQAQFEAATYRVDSFHLVESQLQRSGPIYTDLVRFKLD